MLIVCGFAFDPHVSEEANRYGKLTVLPAKMNPDLARGEELLTDETVKVCAYTFSESAFLQATQAIIELTLRTI